MSDVGETLAGRRIGERLDDRGIEPGDDGLGRVLGRPETVPELDLDTGETSFRKRGDLGSTEPAGLGGNADDLELSGAIRASVCPASRQPKSACSPAKSCMAGAPPR